MHYTLTEQTAKNYTVQDAINAAKARCEGQSINVTSVGSRDRREAITLVELNQIADSIVADTGQTY